MNRICFAALLAVATLRPVVTVAETPAATYIFPAGAQRGTTVDFHVGGHYLYEGAPFKMRGAGIKANSRIKLTKTLWFEGPVIPQPASQRKEDYPKDYAGQVEVAADASLGNRRWYTWTSQGVTPGMKFVIGNLPEIVEQEIDGRPIPTPVKLPVTINGRIFPREDIDIWTVDAKAGQTITCEVVSARLGYPLDSRLEVRDPDGRLVAENVDAFGTDSFLRFRADVDGTYAIHIHDINYSGLQHFVYRLTITAGPYLDFVYPLGGRGGSTTNFELLGAHMPPKPVAVTLPNSDQPFFLYRGPVGLESSKAVTLQLDSLPEHLESEPNNESAQTTKVSGAAILNGRIDRPGDVDVWAFEAKQDDQFEFDLYAARLGSALDSVLTLRDSTGKQLATSDDIGKGQTDSKLTRKFSADGTYFIRITDRLTSRGGPRFAYRLRVSELSAANFQVQLDVDTITLERGGQAKFKVDVSRSNFADEIQLEFDKLPAGVTATGTTFGKNKTTTQIVLKADETAKIQTLPLRLRGKALIDEKEVVRQATLLGDPGEPAIDEILLGVTLKTPFKIFAAFETKFAPRGTVYVRHYKLDLGDYKGSIEIGLADRQARHLQGVTGPTFVLPPGTTEFDYPVTLPPWMVIGRTSRTCLVAIGVVQEPDGTKHKVSHSSQAQDDQIIVLVDPVRMSVKAASKSFRVQPGQRVIVPVQIGRGTKLNGPAKVELVLPKHIQGLSAKPITIAADQDHGQLAVDCASDQLGPFNMPIVLRATIIDDRGHPVISETKLTFVPPR